MNNEQKLTVKTFRDADTGTSRKVTVTNPTWAPEIVRVELENLTILHFTREDAEHLANQLQMAANNAEEWKKIIGNVVVRK
jgi:hypothetical protein